MGKISTSITINAGDFNVKIGKGMNQKIASASSASSRGRRHENASKLAEFHEMNNKVIANRFFQHTAKHITIWF